MSDNPNPQNVPNPVQSQPGQDGSQSTSPGVHISASPVNNQGTSATVPAGSKTTPEPTEAELREAVLKQNRKLRNQDRFQFPHGIKVPDEIRQAFDEYDETNPDPQVAEFWTFNDPEFTKCGRI